MQQSDFSKLCKTYGFAQVGSHYYVRCIGDGLLQSIYTGRKLYIAPSSPHYSVENRKSNGIHIGIYSLYYSWQESLFAPGIHNGFFVPDHFRSDPSGHREFYGFVEESDKMERFAFAQLDSIDTQEKYLHLYDKVCKVKIGTRIHDLSLIAPFFMCGKTDDAIYELCYHYMHFREGFRITNSNLLQSGDLDTYYALETKLLDRFSTTTELWRAILSRRYDYIHMYLQNNFNQNTALIDKYNIARMKNFRLRDIPYTF